MDAETPMSVPELLAALGGRLTTYHGIHLAACPECGVRWAEVAEDGTRHLCRACTEAEIGEPLDELAQRITAVKTLAQWGRLPRDDDGRVVYLPRRRH